MKKNRYVILISGMLIQLCAGIIYMWSVFKKPVATHLNWDENSAVFTSSIMLSAFVLGIIFGGRLQDKIGPKKITLAGSLMISLGMISTAFVPASAPWLLYLTYGVAGGFGVGFVYTCTIATIQKWFPDKRGFATGMIVSAFGFSMVLFAPAARALLGSLGVKNTFLVFGFSFLIICCACSFFIERPEGTTAAVPAAASSQKQFTTAEMLRTNQFYLIAGSMLFLLPAYFILNPLLMTLGEARNLPENIAVFAVMITGICSAAGRLIISWMSDKTGFKTALLLIGSLTLCGSLCMSFAQGVFFLVCVAVIAFAFGGSSGLYAAVTASKFGTKNAGMNFGCVMLAFGISALLSPAAAGMLPGENHTSAFILAAITAAVSIVLMLMIKTVNPAKNK
jgi:Sugar phosphate permease